MNNGKLQAKQETLKSLHCPSLQSSLFNSRGSSLRSLFSSLISHSPAPNPDQSTNSPSFSYQHNSKCATRSPQQLFIDVSTELLRQGKNVRFQAPGRSMHPTIKEMETIMVVPVAPFDIKRGDILLYLAGRKAIAHRVVSIKTEKGDPSIQSSRLCPQRSVPITQSSRLSPQQLFILRGDASATCDDPVKPHQILGKVVSVEKNGRSVNLYSRKVKMLHIAYVRASRLKRRMARIFSGMRTFNGRNPS